MRPLDRRAAGVADPVGALVELRERALGAGQRALQRAPDAGRGDLVRVLIAGANRDPAVFADPDRFDVTRANARRHVAFAHGPHACIAMHLARLEAHTAVEQLMARLPELRLDPDAPTAPRGLVFRKPPALRVLWTAPGSPV